MKPGIEYQGLHWGREPVTGWDRRRDNIVSKLKTMMRAMKRRPDPKEFTISSPVSMSAPGRS